MKNLITILIVCVIQLFLEASASHAHHGGATAYAIPLEGITIDGNLDDWPEDMIREMRFFSVPTLWLPLRRLFISRGRIPFL